MTRKGYKINQTWGLICGVLLLLLAWGVKASVASPYMLLHQVECLDLLPPLWILGLLWFGIYFLLGFTGGQLCALRALAPTQDLHRFKGSLYFLLFLIFSFLWYAWLFGKAAFLLSWLACGLSVVMAFFCGYHWHGLHKLCGWMLWLISALFLLLWLYQLMLMLRI